MVFINQKDTKASGLFFLNFQHQLLMDIMDITRKNIEEGYHLILSYILSLNKKRNLLEFSIFFCFQTNIVV